MLSEEFSKEMWDCWRDVSVAYGTFAKKMGGRHQRAIRCGRLVG